MLRNSSPNSILMHLRAWIVLGESKFFRWSLIGFLLATALATVLPDNYLGMLLKAFAVQTGILALLMSVVWLIARKIRLAIFAATCCLIIVAPVWTSVQRPPVANEIHGKAIKVAHYNVLYLNWKHQDVAAIAKRSKADLISFQEVTKTMEKALVDSLGKSYPYQLTDARDGTPYGIALFSKIPFEEADFINYRGINAIDVVVRWQGEATKVLTVHTRAPTRYGNYQWRNTQIRKLQERLNAFEGPKFAVGDFNAVPWDPIMQEFATKTNLSDSRQGLAPTYGFKLPIVMIPLDYIFYSSDLVCTGFQTREVSGSDHHGVESTFKKAPTKSSKNLSLKTP